MSIFRATRHYKDITRRNSPYADVEFRRIVHTLVDPVSVLGVDVRPMVYQRLIDIYGEDDLELFGLCLAIQNKYDFLCWDAAELSWAELASPGISTKILADLIDD